MLKIGRHAAAAYRDQKSISRSDDMPVSTSSAVGFGAAAVALPEPTQPVAALDVFFARGPRGEFCFELFAATRPRSRSASTREMPPELQQVLEITFTNVLALGDRARTSRAE